MEIRSEFAFELNLQKSFNKLPWLIPLLSISTGILLIGGLAVCMHYFELSYYWTIIPAGLIAHAFFIIIVHDGAHQSITTTKFDRILMNLGAAFMLLPFYGELFRKYHLLHHGNTNSELDPLWPKMKKGLYDNHRWFYIMCEGIPLLFTAYLIFKSDKEKKAKKTKSQVIGAKINYGYIIIGTIITLAIIYFVQPPLLFCLGTLFVLNITAKVRHWCEHIGEDLTKESNTFWFPLGMGIGNHDTHHHYPRISWVVLLFGLFVRKKNTNIFKTIYGVFFKKSFVHYE